MPIAVKIPQLCAWLCSLVMCGLDTRQPASNTYTNSLNGFSENGRSYDMKLAILDTYCVMNHCDTSLKDNSMANYDPLVLERLSGSCSFKCPLQYVIDPGQDHGGCHEESVRRTHIHT